jgi:hypothetical protein
MVDSHGGVLISVTDSCHSVSPACHIVDHGEHESENPGDTEP